MEEAFSTPRPNLVVSNRGYSVEFEGRFGIRYTDATRDIEIDSEPLAEPGSRVVYRGSFKKVTPNATDQAVAQHEVDEILAILKRVFDFKEYQLEVG